MRRVSTYTHLGALQPALGSIGYKLEDFLPPADCIVGPLPAHQARVKDAMTGCMARSDSITKQTLLELPVVLPTFPLITHMAVVLTTYRWPTCCPATWMAMAEALAITMAMASTAMASKLLVDDQSGKTFGSGLA